METTTKEILEKIKATSVIKLETLAYKLMREGVNELTIDRAIQDFIKIEKKRLYKESIAPKHISDVIVNVICNDVKDPDSRIEMIVADMMTENGIPYRFQYPIGPYRVDFLVWDHLVVEIDGPHHKHQIEYDDVRDKYLRKMGYEVLRVPVKILTLSPDAFIEGLFELKTQAMQI